LLFILSLSFLEGFQGLFLFLLEQFVLCGQGLRSFGKLLDLRLKRATHCCELSILALQQSHPGLQLFDRLSGFFQLQLELFVLLVELISCILQARPLTDEAVSLHFNPSFGIQLILMKTLMPLRLLLQPLAFLLLFPILVLE